MIELHVGGLDYEVTERELANLILPLAKSSRAHPVRPRGETSFARASVSAWFLTSVRPASSSRSSRGASTSRCLRVTRARAHYLEREARSRVPTPREDGPGVVRAVDIDRRRFGGW
jgi:hypothetical protein